MPEIPLDPIVLGHNPFFGVDHLSRERGSQREAQFEDPGTILDMVRFSAEHGVRAMMMSTHPRSTLVAGELRRDRELASSIALYPLLPYVTKYVRQSNEKGLVNLVLDQLRSAGWGERLQVLGSGGLGLLKKDYPEMLRTLIRIELMPFQGLRMKGVFLHDALTDLALALDIPEVFEIYCSEVSERFGAEPGFATKNLPFLASRFRTYGLRRPLVLAHWNKAGFGMNPSREACEKCLEENDLRLMAMGTLASGYLKPGEAYEYLFGLSAIESVVVGVSSRGHAQETFAAIEKHRKSKVV